MSDFTGMSATQVAKEIPLYIKSNGDVSAGLINRRAKEVELFKPSGTSTPTPVGENETNRYNEYGTCYPLMTINFRSTPNAQSSSNIMGQYYKGESVNYNLVVITNKYVYISWIGGSGARRYMAVRDQVTGERFANCV
jgi:Bacterial SH3 domain.